MQKSIKFSKYHGTGNDFILIDGFNHEAPELSEQEIQEMCHRRFGIGADGLIILKPKQGYDFEMDFYNSDGRNGSMCGNGGRCVVSFAHDIGVIDKETTFWAPDGVHFARYESSNEISLKMQDVNKIDDYESGMIMDTGSPHLVVFESKLEGNDFYNKGRDIRFNSTFKDEGINVNFVELKNKGISIITYERGVEDLTYSCGTGTVAAALATSLKAKQVSPIKADTKGGQLEVQFEYISRQEFKEIWLIGPAIKSYSGVF